MREMSFRVDVLRNGVSFERLEFTDPPSIFADSSADICMSLKGTFIHNPNVDYITDELRPVVIIDGVEHPAGVYIVSTIRQSVNAAGIVRDSIEAYDRTIRLSWAKLEERPYYAAGGSYDQIISQYLTKAGIDNVMFTASGYTLQSDREDWDIGTSYLKIINTLLSELAYNPIRFSLDGVAQLTPYVSPSIDNVAHTYRQDDVLSMLSPGMSIETDMYSKPNVFIAILSNPEYPEPIMRKAENDSMSSPLSTVRRGLRIPQVYNVSNIASDIALDRYARQLRDESMLTSETVTISTGIQPERGVGDTVALMYNDTIGIYRELSWTYTLQAGSLMSHKLQRTVIT